MSKHTDGPWFVGQDRANDCPKHRNSGLALVDTGRSSEWPIARLCEWNNARLIAAAPDLLAALTHLVRNLDESHLAGSWASMAEARATIAKAEGREIVPGDNPTIPWNSKDGEPQ